MKRMRSTQLLPVLSAILLASGALAEDNLTKLGQFKTTGVTEFTTIAQDGPAGTSRRPPHYAPKPARPILTQAESKSLIFQHYRSRTALCRQNSDAGMRPV